MLAAKDALAAEAFDKAKALADEALRLSTDTKHWNHGNVVHDMTLSKLASRWPAGDREVAAAYVVKASAAPASPQLNAYGMPHIPVLKKLLDQGGRATVLAYLRGIGRVWTEGPVNQWIAQIEKGRGAH